MRLFGLNQKKSGNCLQNYLFWIYNEGTKITPNMLGLKSWRYNKRIIGVRTWLTQSFVSQSEDSIAFFLTLTRFLSLSLANLSSLHLLHMFHQLCPNTFFYKELYFPLATRRIIKIPILLMSLAFFFHCKVK